jgi:hypothetical protein
MIDRDFWQLKSNEIFNYTELNSSLVSFVVIMHTRTDQCLDYISCINVISKLEVSCAIHFMTNRILNNFYFVY